MARPCFPFPTNCTVATLWDGTTLGPSGFPSGSPSVDSPVVGAGTPYPVGLTLAQCAELFFKVRLWSASFTVNSEMTVSPVSSDGIYPYNPGPLAISGVIPLINGIAECDSSESKILFDWWGLKEASGARGNSMGATVAAYEFGSGAVADFLAGSDNYTATELNDVLSCSLIEYNYCSIGARTELRYCDGLYYPEIAMEAAGGPGCLYSYSTAAPYSPELVIRVDRTAGNLTFELPSGDITIPIYLYVADEDLGSHSGPLTFLWNITSASFDITVSPVKYWPYKDAAGVALYDEDTGALV